ncbi:putative T7SS-secreted protein [Nakamurella sp. A5-74]|uniref:T7SS-secreted protein n=1 Tax=Nakamurella sp. A5-74 TaxID=3158264 RepID=A0AAU8DQS6_9ACTN
MSDTFSLGGDPGSIKASGQTWKSFASAASSASSDIRSVDAASFQGDEGDTYRGKVNEDLPPRLDKTHEAWEQVGSALITYASTLDDLQSRLATLKTQHDSATQTASAKANNLEGAKSADKTHDQQQTDAKSKLKPGETLPPSTYSSGASAAQSQLNEANNAVQDTINKANQVHSEHRTALNTCCGQIEDAKGKRFEKPPGFWGKLKDSVVDWVKDHADVLKQISGVLKIISAIAGVLSFIPILTPIMGPIALVTGGAALLIDVGLKVITGEGSWASIGLDAALMLLPGAGKLVGKALKSTTNGAKALNGLKGAKNAAMAKTLTALKNSKAGTYGARGLTRFKNSPALWRVANKGRTPYQAAKAYVKRHGDDGIATVRANPNVAKRASANMTTRAKVAAAQKKSGDNLICPTTKQPLDVQMRNGRPVRRNPETGRPKSDGVAMPNPQKADIGHEFDHAWSWTSVQATAEGWTKAEVRASQQNPNIFHGFEDRAANRANQSQTRLENLLP